jgi:hypothetical protein
MNTTLIAITLGFGLANAGVGFYLRGLFLAPKIEYLERALTPDQKLATNSAYGRGLRESPNLSDQPARPFIWTPGVEPVSLYPREFRREQLTCACVVTMTCNIPDCHCRCGHGCPWCRGTL